LVTKSIFIGLMFVAAAAVTKIGYHCLEVLSEWIRKRKHSDAYDAMYGGRLRGGTGKSTYQDLLQTEGLSARDLFGYFSPSSRRQDVTPADSTTKSALQGQVDPSRLKEGDRFSFIYHRGTRHGVRREVQLVSKLDNSKGIQLRCSEIDSAGSQISRNYWPSCTSGALYAGEEWPSVGSSAAPSSPEVQEIQ
jgi:hypothetical protein